MRNRDDLGFAIGLEIVGPIGADRRQREVSFGAQLPTLLLQPEPERIAIFPIDQQQVIQTVPIDIYNLHRLDQAGKGDFLGLPKRMILVLRDKIDMIFRQQHQVGAAIAVQVTCPESIGRKLAIFNRPAFGRAPTVRALVVLHDQFLWFAIVSNIRTAIAVQISDHQRRDALLRCNGIDAKPRIRRQLVNLTLTSQSDFLGEVGLAGLIIEQIDLRARVVDNNQIVQPIAIEIGNVQLTDLVIDRKDFRPGEAEPIRGIFRNAAERKQRQRDQHASAAKAFPR